MRVQVMQVMPEMISPSREKLSKMTKKGESAETSPLSPASPADSGGGENFPTACASVPLPPSRRGFFMTNQHLDLFGDPVRYHLPCVGRPYHVPTDEKRCKVKELRDRGWRHDQIAPEIGVSPPTLRRHYFAELGSRSTTHCRRTDDD